MVSEESSFLLQTNNANRQNLQHLLHEPILPVPHEPKDCEGHNNQGLQEPLADNAL